MNILENFYIKINRARFQKTFKPLAYKQKGNYLVSLPDDEQRFVQTLTLLDGLKRMGTVVLLSPRRLEPICARLNAKAFEILYYDRAAAIFSREYKRIREELGERHFDTIIELNKPANLSLPYLTPAEMRICFHDDGTFPYYNLMIKGTVLTLCDFFSIGVTHPKKLFHFSVRQYDKLINRLAKQRPILLVNSDRDIAWEGDKIIVGQTLPASSPEVYEVLYFCDAYYGNQDALFEFAKVFEKKVLAT
jgi:hypothetical protein